MQDKERVESFERILDPHEGICKLDSYINLFTNRTASKYNLKFCDKCSYIMMQYFYVIMEYVVLYCIYLLLYLQTCIWRWVIFCLDFYILFFTVTNKCTIFYILLTGPLNTQPPECVIPDDVLIQFSPPDDEHLLLKTCRGTK